MANNEESELRITAWPGIKLPIPEIEVWPVTLIDGGQFGEFLSYATGAQEVAQIKLPEDFYLRELFDLELSSSNSILAFTRTFGRMGRTGWRDLIATDYGLEMEAYPKLKAINRLQQRFLNDRGFSHPLDKYEIISIEDFIQHAAVLRDTVRIWLMLCNQIDFQTLVGSWENQVFKPPHTEGNSALYLKDFLNAGLRPFHANIRIDYDNDESMATPFDSTGLSIYSASCLQIANDIAEKSNYRVCANESCRRLFSKQRGRSEFGQFRTKSIKYCSASCAKAQAQRELRRRQAKVRQLHSDGATPAAIAKEMGIQLDRVKKWVGSNKKKWEV